MNKPLEKALSDFRAKSASRFFMPGHKGNAFADFLPALSFDVTELDETGNLYHAEGVIAQSQNEAARVARVPALLYSAGGSTLCIQSLMASFFKEGDRILLPRASHKAALHAMGLLGMEPVWVPSLPELCGRTDTERMVKQILRGECDGVFVTSPDYYGICTDIKVLSTACRQARIPLLVDSAHGGHLPLIGMQHAIELGADGATVSLHKTLPALTGAAAAYLADPEMAASVRQWMSVFGSSSPSYLIMLSIERCFGYMDSNAAADGWRRLAERCTALQQSAGSLLPSTDDPTRLVVDLSGFNSEAVKAQIEKCRLTPELQDSRAAIFIPSPLNTEEDWGRLEAFIQSLGSFKRGNPPSESNCISVIPTSVMPLRKALLSPRESVPIEKAVGKICAEVVSVCPPATVLLAPGEKIELGHLQLLRNYGIFTVNVIK